MNMSIDEFKIEINEIKGTLSRIETALIGDSEHGITGLAARVQANEKYIEKDKKMKWMIAGVAAFVSVILFKIIGVYDKIKKW